MKSVMVQVEGGNEMPFSADSVGEITAAKNLGGYQVTVNGEPADASYQLRDDDLVFYAKANKAG
jgi:hypothetical protein